MRYLLTLILVILYTTCYSIPTFNKLYDANPFWAKQKDIPAGIDIYAVQNLPPRQLLQLHLSLVEKTLRKRKKDALTSNQKLNRTKALSQLHEYWQLGNFPQNEDYNTTTPIFIDKHDNICAVGYLLKTTGYEHIARRIAKENNLACVYEIERLYPEVSVWAKEYGFSVDELAWIQGGYSPKGDCKKVGYGTNGSVTELYSDDVNQRLYVGGRFTKVDSTINAKNVAYITENNGAFTWHSMGGGVVGSVYAIATYGSNVFVAGQLDSADGVPVNNVALWNGTTWQAAGCLNGIVKDMIVYRDSLYACGQFVICSITSPGNFAVWRGNAWHHIPSLTGMVNTMEIKDSTLYLGGAFNYNSLPANAIKWTRSGGFQTLNNILNNEVMDFDVFYDTLYAGCKNTSTVDTMLFTRLLNNTWDTTAGYKMGFRWDVSFTTEPKSVNTLCVNADTFMYGGNFYSPYSMTRNKAINWYCPWYMYMKFNGADALFMVDSTVKKMAKFKNYLFVGGDFYNSGSRGIGVQKVYQSISNPWTPLYVTSASLQGACAGTGGRAYVKVMSGTKPYSFLWSNGERTDTAKNLPPGNNTVIVEDSTGARVTQVVNIMMTNIDTALAVSGAHLYCKTITTGYTWVKCDIAGYSIIPGAIYQHYTAPVSGSYALIISKGGCIDTTACYSVTVTNTGIKSQAIDKIRVYPNPAGDVVNIGSEQPLDNVTIQVVDALGRIFIENKRTNTTTVPLNISMLSSGFYNLILTDETGKSAHYKLLKQ